MSKKVLHGAALGVAVLLLAAPAPPAAAQEGRPSRAVQGPTTRAEDAELDFVSSDQAIWNSRAVNDSIYQDGGSVNSVMFQRKASSQLELGNYLPTPKVEDVQVLRPMSAPSVIRIQGRQVQLPPTNQP